MSPDSLDLHQTQNQKMKSLTDPAFSFHFPETEQVFSNPAPTNYHTLIIYKYSARTKLRHVACDKADEKLSNPWGNKKKSWTHLPSSFPWLTPDP